MELYEFAENFPELYDKFNKDVRYIISEDKLNGGESLSNWDNIVDNIARKYEQDDYYEYTLEEIPAQQIPYGGYRDWDGRYRRRHRRYRDFNVRDIIRILFLRELFDRDRGYWY